MDSALQRWALSASEMPPAQSLGPSVPSESRLTQHTGASTCSLVTNPSAVSWLGPPSPHTSPMVTVVSPAEMSAHGAENGRPVLTISLASAEKKIPASLASPSSTVLSRCGV